MTDKIVRFEPKRSLRERVARKIDPTAWGVGPEHYGLDPQIEEDLKRWQRSTAWAGRQLSLQAADEIIAMVLAGPCSGGDAA